MRSPVQLQGAIQQLRDLSLVRYESNKDAFVLRIHDLIQTTIQESAWRQGLSCAGLNPRCSVHIFNL
jgi:hypothetical protein